MLSHKKNNALTKLFLVLERVRAFKTRSLEMLSSLFVAFVNKDLKKVEKIF